jgi:Extensin-like protein C-terminus
VGSLVGARTRAIGLASLASLAALASSGCAARIASPVVAAAVTDFNEGHEEPLLAAAATVPFDPSAAPAVRYGAMDKATCEAELGRRAIPWTAVPEARGVLAPVRITGPLHGVLYRFSLPAAQRATSPYEVIDCRLVLALDDFAQILARYDVAEVVHLSAWRPPPAKRWPEGKLGTRHPGGLAMDMAIFRRKDGTQLEVLKHFHGRIGATTCGPRTGPQPKTAEADALRGIVCEAADARLFNVALTPDYNRQHRNHFHLEVTPRVSWFVVH